MVIKVGLLYNCVLDKNWVTNHSVLTKVGSISKLYLKHYPTTINHCFNFFNEKVGSIKVKNWSTTTFIRVITVTVTDSYCVEKYLTTTW